MLRGASELTQVYFEITGIVATNFRIEFTCIRVWRTIVWMGY